MKQTQNTIAIDMRMKGDFNYMLAKKKIKPVLAQDLLDQVK